MQRVPVLLLFFLLGFCDAARAAQVVAVSGGEVRVEGLEYGAEPGEVLEAYVGKDPCALLQVTAGRARKEAFCHVLAGEVRTGAPVAPLAPPPQRVALLTDEPAGPAATELKALYPGSITVLGPEGRGLEPSRFDVAVSVLYRAASLALFRFATVEAFAAAGRTALIGLPEYASRRGVGVDEYRGRELPRVRCVRTDPVLAGIGLGDEIAWCGQEGELYTQQRLTALPPGAEALLVSAGPDAGVVALVEKVGERGGQMVAIDLVSPKGMPGRDPGARWKWVPLANVSSRGMRFARALPGLVDPPFLSERLQALVRRFGDRLALEDGTGEPLTCLRFGERGRPLMMVVADAADPPSAAALLRLAEVLATPSDYPHVRWLAERFSVLMVWATGALFRDDVGSAALRDLLTAEPVAGVLLVQHSLAGTEWELVRPHPGAAADSTL
ncbi:MAG: hypothetical protein QHJ73_18015, partial [Armatimonadota bacterium]|nr:hypothetical protein [Armatimonadota bacterium]